MASPEPIEGRCAAAVSISERNPAGGYCEKVPMHGQRRCRTHGGSAPHAKAAAARRQAEQVAVVAVATYGLSVDVHPVEALRTELARTYGAVLWLEGQIRALAPEDLIWGVTEIKEVGSGERPGIDRTEAAAVHGWMEHYRWERKHLAEVSATCIKVGIDLLEQERLRQQASDFLAVMRRVVTALGHEVDDPGVVALIAAAMSPARALEAS